MVSLFVAPFVVASTAAASADPLVPSPTASPSAAPKSFLTGHLPIVEFDPQADFADPPSTTNATGTGLNGVVSGTIDLAGSVTIPITSNISIAYVRDAGSFLNSTFSRIAVPGVGYEMVGSLKRHNDAEKIDIGLGKTGATFEGGFEHNDFECCLPLEFHTGYVAVQYAAPGIKALNGLKFIYTEKAMTAAHNPSPDTLASEPVGLDVRKREYGLDQILTAVIPVSKNFYGTATFFNGAYDFFENEPFPYRFNGFIESGDFVLSPNATFELATINLTQMNQGSPFPAPNTIHFENYYATLKLKYDFNKLLSHL